jgi:hypothetical protein
VTSSRPWRAILDAIRSSSPPELDATFASAWLANMATPAVLVVPVRRQADPPCDVRWELALQVVLPLQSDDDEPLHALLELALAAMPPGVTVGDTTYAQDDRAGGSYLVSTTTLTA